MAIRKMRVDQTQPGRIVWVDAVTNEELFAVLVPFNAEHGSFADSIVRYGITQIVQDGGALEAGASLGERIAAMRKRAASINDETYRIGQRAGMPDADVFAACVAVGLAENTPEHVQKWRDAKPAQRAKIARHPKVVAYLSANAPVEAADAAIEATFG